MKFRMKKLLAMLMAAMMIFSNMGSAFAGTFGAENQAHTEITPRNAGSGHTVKIKIADGVSWEGHLYVVLKQENISTQEPPYSCVQYYVEEINKAGNTISLTSSTIFKTDTQYGIEEYPFDSLESVEARLAVSAYGNNGTINAETPINNPSGVKYHTTENPILNYPVSNITSGNTTTITIGSVEPTPHMVAVSGLDDGDTFDQNRVVAKVGETTYHGNVGVSVVFDETGSNTIPDEADEGSVKIVANESDVPVTSILSSNSTNEYYISGPVLDSTSHTYQFTATKKEISYAKCVVQGGTLGNNYYVLASDNNNRVIGFAQLKDGDLSFINESQNKDIYNNTSFVIVKYTGDYEPQEVQLTDIETSTSCVNNGGSMDGLTFAWNTVPKDSYYTINVTRLPTATVNVTSAEGLESGYDYYIVAYDGTTPIGYSQYVSGNDLSFGDGVSLYATTTFKVVRVEAGTQVVLSSLASADSSNTLTASGSLGTTEFAWNSEAKEDVFSFASSQKIDVSADFKFLDENGNQATGTDETYFIRVNNIDEDGQQSQVYAQAGNGPLVFKNDSGEQVEINSISGLNVRKVKTGEDVSNSTTWNQIESKTENVSADNGSYNLNGYRLSAPTYDEASKTYHFVAAKPGILQVKVELFEDEEKTHPVTLSQFGNLKIVARITGQDNSGNDNSWVASKDVSSDTGIAVIDSTVQFEHNNGGVQPTKRYYQKGDNIELYLGLSNDISADGGAGTVSVTNGVEESGCLKDYKFTRTYNPNTNTYTYTGINVPPFGYSVEVQNANGEKIYPDDSALDNLYIVGSIRGDYYQEQAVGLNVPTDRQPVTGSFDDQNGYKNSSDASAYYTPWDNVTVSLATTSNARTPEALISNEEVLRGKYQVFVEDNENAAKVIVKQLPELKIKTAFSDNAWNTSIATSIASQYKLLVKMTDHSGNEYYSIQPLSASGVTVPSFKRNINNNWDTVGYYTGIEDLSVQLIKASGVDDYSVISSGSSPIYTEADFIPELYTFTTAKDGHELTTTFKPMSNTGVTHTIKVEFYDKKDGTLETPENVDGSYFFRLGLTRGNKVVGYKFVDADADNGDVSGLAAAIMADGTYEQAISADITFQMVDEAGNDVSGAPLMFYDPSSFGMEVRLYKYKDGQSNLPTSLKGVASIGTDTIDGFDFWETKTVVTEQGESKTALTTVKLYEGYAKKYQVQIESNYPLTIDNLKLYVDAVHATSDPDHFDDNVTYSNATSAVKVIEDHTDASSQQNHWDGVTDPTVKSVSGNETFTYYIEVNGNPISDSQVIRIGKDSYTVRYTSKDRTKEHNNTNKTTVITDYIVLEKFETSPALTPDDILGEAAEFGIVANRFEQQGHTETNFAVKSFKSGDNIDIDGSGSAAIPFYVAAMDNGSRLQITKGTTVDVDVFYGDGLLSQIDDSDPDLKVHVEKVPMAKSDVEAYVQSLIDHGKNMSTTMLSRNNYTPVNDGSKVIDTTSFPDDSTIYIDCTNIIDWIGSDWKINKLEGQSLVFNIPGKGTVRINKFETNVYKYDDKGALVPVIEKLESTTSALNAIPVQNKAVDDYIFSHIFFNAYEASHVNLVNVSGLFLAPEANEVNQDNGAGWIVTGGTVKTSTEWHFYRHTRHYHSVAETGIKAKKTLEGGTLHEGDFTFTLRSDETDSEGLPLIDRTETNESDGDVIFGRLKFAFNPTNHEIEAGFIDLTSQLTSSNTCTLHLTLAEDTTKLPEGVTPVGATSHRITVTVRKDAHGKIHVTTDPADTTKFKFTNQKEQEQTVKATLSATKVFTGRDWTDADSFEFTLAADASNPDGATLPQRRTSRR